MVTSFTVAGCEALTVSYPLDTGCSYRGVKATGAWS